MSMMPVTALYAGPLPTLNAPRQLVPVAVAIPNVINDTTKLASLTDAAEDAQFVLASNVAGNAARKIGLGATGRSLLGAASAAAAVTILGLGSFARLDSANPFTVGGHSIATQTGVIGLSVDGVTNSTVPFQRWTRSGASIAEVGHNYFTIWSTLTSDRTHGIRVESAFPDGRMRIKNNSVATASGLVFYHNSGIIEAEGILRANNFGFGLSGGYGNVDQSTNSNILKIQSLTPSNADSIVDIFTQRVGGTGYPLLRFTAPEYRWHRTTGTHPASFSNGPLCMTLNGLTGTDATITLWNHSSTSTNRAQSAIQSSWANSTDSTRQGRIEFDAYGIVSGVETAQAGLTITARSTGVPLIGLGGELSVPATWNWFPTATNSNINATFYTSGTGTQAAFTLFGTPTATNAGYGLFAYIDGTGIRIDSSANGTGTVRPIDMRIGGTSRIRMDVNGIGFFGVTPVVRQTLPAAGVVSAADIRTALINLGLCQ